MSGVMTCSRPTLAAWGLAWLLAAVLFGACGEEPRPHAGAEPGIWLLLLPPGPLSIPEPGGQLRMIDLVSGRERTFGEPRQYVLGRWSPDGSRIAAVSISSDENAKDPVSVYIFAVDGTLLRTAPVYAPLWGSKLAWSPDSTRLAIIGGGGIDVLDRDGTKLGGMRATPLANGSFHGGSNYLDHFWSPDSSRVATISNTLLVLVDRDGKGGRELDTPQPPGAGQLMPVGWESNDCIALLQSGPEQHVKHVGCVSNTPATWQPPEVVDPTTLIGPPPDEASTLLPGMAWTGSRATADGAGETWMLQTSRDRVSQANPLRDIALAVNAGGARTVVSVGNALREIEFDVVVVPGWSGSPPPTRDLSAGRAFTWPLPRPDVTPAEEPTMPPPPSAVPYPSPRGERVQPLVADVPVFPGAAEIDGFTAVRSGATVAIQHFATDAPLDQVIPFFEEALTAQGYTKLGGGSGPDGSTRDFVRGRDRVQVSTVYIPRPGSERAEGEVPYGFQGKGVPFVPGADGKRWFFVVTLHAPGP